MRRYWYLASTLPYFPFGAEAPMTVSEFDELCSRLVERHDRQVLAAVPLIMEGKDAPAASASPLLREYFEWERGTRNALVLLRARSLQRDPEPWIRPGVISGDAHRAASAIHSAPDPLQAAMLFERERWIAIERLASLSAFDLDTLIAYKMKLMLAERLGRLSAERGREGFALYYQDIISAASGRAGTVLQSGAAT